MLSGGDVIEVFRRIGIDLTLSRVLHRRNNKAPIRRGRIRRHLQAAAMTGFGITAIVIGILKSL